MMVLASDPTAKGEKMGMDIRECETRTVAGAWEGRGSVMEIDLEVQR